MTIDILVIAYHAKADLAETLSSVARTTSPGYRLTVYDNAVHNYPLSWLWNRFFEASGRPLVCVLNPDVVLFPGWDTELKECMRVNADCAAASPISNHKPHDEAFGNQVPSILPGDAEASLPAILKERFKDRRFVPSSDHRMAPGHCCVVRKDMWRRICGFNEQVPFAGNDYDFNLRLVKAGQKLYVCTHVPVFHKWNKSINEGIAMGTFDTNSWSPRFSSPPAGTPFPSL
jgi:hypothetical protein